MREKRNFLTKEGFKRIKEEIRKLERRREKIMKEGVPSIFHSEEIDPEFLSFREELEFLEKRIFELRNILENSKIIKPPSKINQKKVSLGAKVTVEINGKEKEFIIVGPFEVDPSSGKISHESLIGRALLGKKIGDIVFCSHSKKPFKIKKIKYERI